MSFINFVGFNNANTNKMNTGDLYCIPSLYFKFEDYGHNDYHYYENHPDEHHNICILGGGGILVEWAYDYLLKLSNYKRKIVWGAGINDHDTNNYKVYEELKKFDLVGIRDNPKFHPYSFVPCVSCMHHLFDKHYTIQEEIVVYEHMDFEIPLNFKKLNNRGLDIENKIEHLASANCIVTNTYHGMYWGILLGKKVVVYKPFSNRLLYTPFSVEYCDESNYREKLEISSTYPHLLDQYRKINVEFYNKVSTIVQCT